MNKKTFTLNEVLAIIENVQLSNFVYSIKDYANDNGFDEEQAARYAAEEYAHEQGWFK